MEKTYIGVIGSSGDIERSVLDAAETIGRLIAQRDGVLVCGGRGGVMEASSRGAKSAQGLTVGILPGLDREDANAYLDAAIPTGLGSALRNFITVRSCHALIMLHGRIGTLSEVVLAYQHGIPVVALQPTKGWADRLKSALLEDGAYFDDRKQMKIHYAQTPEEAVEMAFDLVGTVPKPEEI